MAQQKSAEPAYVFPRDWPLIKDALSQHPSDEAWSLAEVILRARLNRLYFDPIRKLTREPGERGQGEGFSILTIQCAVLEFLAALRKGWRFKPGHKVDGQNNFYGSSRSLYTVFLLQQEPFANVFTIQERADAFYSDIRCGLVHEGQTKNGWRIWRGKQSDPLVDFNQKAVYRDVMQTMIEAYLDRYCQELIDSTELQSAFVRKFDYLYENTVITGPKS